MAYGLSFSDDFYAAHGDAEGELQLNSRGQPTTLYSAIALLLSKPSSERRRLCLAFKASVAALQDDIWRVIERAREIDTCDSIGRNGVPVYVTPFNNGWGLTVTVYEADRDCEAAQ
jgi:hypothetical protein